MASRGGWGVWEGVRGEGGARVVSPIGARAPRLMFDNGFVIDLQFSRQKSEHNASDNDDHEGHAAARATYTHNKIHITHITHT